MERITDEEFVREMSLLWQNVDQAERNRLAEVIRNYYDQGDRAEAVIKRMQEKID
ncbi:hypothetical protein LCGC14_1887030 [marine sediment metagenome]|uniref:Uncharacterized protein n=1 Tax=marine sediment metagenome TaxID=412755 RepID=A0A0F9G0J2_9ZZZZ